MLGCWIAAAVSASRRNRRTRFWSLVASRTFIATQRRRPRSHALYTAPIEPFPIDETRMYFPTMLLGFSEALVTSSGTVGWTAGVREPLESGLAHCSQR